MRVTQNMMFNDMQYNTNNILSEYMKSGEQSGTQKRVNRPSDDPLAAIKILNYRASLTNSEKYIENSAGADNWLKSADSALQAAQVILTEIKSLTEQAATSTVTPENRLIIAGQIREKFEQLINISNTDFVGDHVFAGHQTGSPAYGMVPGITTQSPELAGASFEVKGKVEERTSMVRFPDAGTIPNPIAMDYEFSLDGGETWITKSLPANGTTLDLDGAQVEFADGLPVNIVAYDPDITPHPTDNGTMLYVRPTAEYQGDDSDAPAEIDIYGNHTIINSEAVGNFKNNVQIRFDSGAQVNANGTVDYSYSTDNGLTWQTDTATTTPGSDEIRLFVEGGYVDLQVGPPGTVTEGQQLIIRPNRASEIGYEIAEGEYIDVTNSGKDIFGGIYQGKDDAFAKPVAGPNLFESISDLIAWADCNNSDGISQALDEIDKVSKHLLGELAEIGGKENRVSLNISLLGNEEFATTSAMSAAEDVDITKLTMTLARQKAAYQAVLQSSSMIMNMNLMSYM